jgi:hypothetical protein
LFVAKPLNARVRYIQAEYRNDPVTNPKGRGDEPPIAGTHATNAHRRMNVFLEICIQHMLQQSRETVIVFRRYDDQGRRCARLWRRTGCALALRRRHRCEWEFSGCRSIPFDVASFGCFNQKRICGRLVRQRWRGVSIVRQFVMELESRREKRPKPLFQNVRAHARRRIAMSASQVLRMSANATD